MVNSSSEDQKIWDWQKDVVRSIADDASITPRDPPPTRSSLPPVRPDPPFSRPVVVNQIVTNPPVVVTRVKAPEPKPSEEISTKAMIGTVVGATAGAFIAYAMVKGASEDRQPVQVKERITYRTIEAPAEHNAVQSVPTTSIPIQDSRSHHHPFPNDTSRVRTIGPPPARAETLVSASGHSRHSNGPESRTYKIVSRDGPIVMIDREQDPPRLYAPSNHTAIKPQTVPHSPPSAPVTEVRIARDVPLPARSQASRYSHGTSATIKDSHSNQLPSVVPDDSISQASTRRSKDSGRSKHRRSSHHGHSKSGHRSEKRDGGGKGSKVERRGSKVGDMVDDVVGIIKGTSIRGSEHRSVRG